MISSIYRRRRRFFSKFFWWRSDAFHRIGRHVPLIAGRIFSLDPQRGIFVSGDGRVRRCNQRKPLGWCAALPHFVCKSQSACSTFCQNRIQVGGSESFLGKNKALEDPPESGPWLTAHQVVDGRKSIRRLLMNSITIDSPGNNCDSDFHLTEIGRGTWTPNDEKRNRVSSLFRRDLRMNDRSHRVGPKKLFVKHLKSYRTV